MARSVKVDLLLEVSQYVRNAKSAERSTKGVADSLTDAAKAGDKTATATQGVGKAMADTARDAARLDRQIDETALGVRDLAREIARTSDVAERAKLAEKLTAKRHDLRGLADLRKMIDVDDETARRSGMRFGAKVADGVVSGLSTAGGPISRAMGNVFGVLPPQAQAAIGAGVLAAIGSVAPLVGGVLAGAVVGGVGIGGVVGGIALASKHPALQAAAKQTGNTLMDTLQRSATSFVPVTITALGTVRSEIRDMGSDFERIFSKSSRFVAPLTQSVTGFVRELLPGIEDAIDRGGPVIDELASWGPKLGGLLSEVFSDFASQAQNGARALAAFWTVMEFGIRMTSNVIVGLAAVYGGMERLSAMLRGDIGKILEMEAAEHRADASGKELAGGLQGLLNGFVGTGDAAGTAAVKVETLAETIDRLSGANLSAEEAHIRLEDAIDRGTEAFRNNGLGIDANNPKQRANRQALLDIASASNDAYDKTFELTGSEYEAAEAAQRGRDAFMALAGKMHVSKEAAILLADKLFKIPNRNVKVTADTRQALAAAEALRARINNMSARINVFAEPSGGFGGGKGTGFGYSTGMRWGGVVEHAQDGLINLREAGVYSAVGPARYAFAEPATGGEAFIPRNGDRDRSLGILEKAANWYGTSIMPQRAPTYVSGGGGGTVRIEATLRWPDGTVAAQIVHDGFTSSPKAMTGLKTAIGRGGGNPKVLER